MFEILKRYFTQNIALKIAALILALVMWFYVVDALNKGTEAERQFLSRMLPPENISAKKLSIQPLIIGKPRNGYTVDVKKIITVPDYCIVVAARDMLEKIRFVYTVPIDVSGVSKTFTKSVPLNPIASGVYMEETLVQVTVPVEKTADQNPQG